jgi:phosphoserine aminotransferase
MREIVNFNPGPAALPRVVLERAQKELVDYRGTGMSIMEHSHRGKAYGDVHRGAMALVKKLMGVPDTHEVLFVQGGASAMFAQVPMNFLTEGRSADYVVTGTWSKKALSEAKLIGAARVAGTGEVGGKFVRIPLQGELDLDPKAAYVHITSNNTIAGTQWHSTPATNGVPLVADMSSDIMSRPIETAKYHFIYAGAQKNLGPSGVVLVVADKKWIEGGSTKIPVIFRYATHLENGSLYNTPPTFSVYMMKLVLDWIDESGGLAKMGERNQKKADALYRAIDESNGFFASPVERAARSQMNVVFRLPSEELENRLIREAEAAGLVGLEGHRSVGGLRASIYNAVGLEGVERLVELMGSFRKKS